MVLGDGQSTKPESSITCIYKWLTKTFEQRLAKVDKAFMEFVVEQYPCKTEDTFVSPRITS